MPPQVPARHRAHARVEDRIRCAKNTGLAHLPSRQLNVNTVWVELVSLACNLLAWTRLLLLDGALATAEPNSCATGCCTSPPAWSAADDDCSSGSTATGPGKTRSSTPSPGSSPCRSRPTDRANSHPYEPDGQAGDPAGRFRLTKIRSSPNG